MTVIFDDDRGPNTEEKPAFFIDRLGHLAEVLVQINDDRDLIMFRAHQHGASLEQIATWADTSVETVQRAIDLLSRPGCRTEEWCVGPKWLKWYPFD
jgi:predicted transcriptional regulator